MPTPFQMPKLGLTMEEGTILEWKVSDGTDVEPGTAVMAVETDKVETDVEIPNGGRLVHVGAVGQTFRCGDIVGWLLAPGESAPVAGPSGSDVVADVVAPPTPSSPIVVPVVAPVVAPGVAPAAAVAAVSADGRLLASPFARNRAKELGVELGTVAGTGPGGRIVADDVAAAAAARPRVPTPAAANGTASGPNATFAALQLAQQTGLDLGAAGISASSPDGRVSRDDVAEHLKLRGAVATPPAATQAAEAVAPVAAVAPIEAVAPVAVPSSGAPSALLQQPTSMVPLRGMRGTIASRMHASLQQMAQLTLMMDANMDAVWADREARKARGTAPGFTDYVIAAAAQALRTHPMANAQVTPEGIAVLPDIHVGMAVALDNGLLVPVVRHTDRLRLDAIAAETTRLAAAARTGALRVDDLAGGTFSVSSLGMYGVDGFTPVINPPNAAILGVGRIRNEVEWTDDASIRRVRRMTLSLTWDHRVLDGAPAAEFCRTIVANLENPASLG